MVMTAMVYVGLLNWYPVLMLLLQIYSFVVELQHLESPYT